MKREERFGWDPEPLTSFERRLFMALFLGVFLFAGVAGWLGQAHEEHHVYTGGVDRVAP